MTRRKRKGRGCGFNSPPRLAVFPGRRARFPAPPPARTPSLGRQTRSRPVSPPHTPHRLHYHLLLLLFSHALPSLNLKPFIAAGTPQPHPPPAVPNAAIVPPFFFFPLTQPVTFSQEGKQAARLTPSERLKKAQQGNDVLPSAPGIIYLLAQLKENHGEAR